MPDTEPVESDADRAYEWTVRALYAALILGNLALIWESYKNTPSGIELRAKAAAWRQRVQNCEGCARRKKWLRAQTGRVIWEATEIVEEAQRGAA